MPRPALSEAEIAARRAQPYNGRPRKSRAAPAQSGTFAGRPRMPKHITGAAKEEWRRVVRSLSARGVLSPDCSQLLELYSTVYARWRQCVEEIEKDGPIVDMPLTDNSGNVTMTRRESQASKCAARLETQLRQLLKELTQTVASRERAKLVKKSPDQEPLPEGSIGAIMKDMEGQEDELIEFESDAQAGCGAVADTGNS